MIRMHINYMSNNDILKYAIVYNTCNITHIVQH